MPTPIKLEFSGKYDDQHAQNYSNIRTIYRRLSHKRYLLPGSVVRWPWPVSLAWC